MFRHLAAIVLITAAPAVMAQDAQAIRDDIAATLGASPTFVEGIADSALPGLWTQVKTLEMSGDTALDTKTKALISLAVAAQIPCQYCIWMDTNTAHGAGATDQEIAEAVAIAGLTRNMSTIFYGTQTDFEKFKKELGGM